MSEESPQQDYRAVFELMAPKHQDFGAVFSLIEARRLSALPFTFCPDPISTFELADDPARRADADRLGVCLHEGRFYIGIFRRDGSGIVASAPEMQADGLAYFLHFDLCGADHP